MGQGHLICSVPMTSSPATKLFRIDHNMGHFRLAVIALPFVISGSDRENKISRVALALPHKKATVFSFLG